MNQGIKLIGIITGIIFALLIGLAIYSVCTEDEYTFNYRLAAEGYSCDDKELARISEDIHRACTKGDMEMAHAMLDVLHAEYLRELTNCNLSSDIVSRIPECRPTYIASRDLVFKNEMMLMVKNGDAYNIPYLLLDMPFDLESPNDGEINYWFASNNKGLSMYVEDVNSFNKKCDDILTLAIVEGNKDVAERVIDLYKPRCYVVLGTAGKQITLPNGKNVAVDGNHGYVYFTNEPKEEAQERINKAFK